MFNYLEVAYPLPDGFTGYRFQTKTLPYERAMDTYKITAEGDLVVQRYDMVESGRWFNFPDRKNRVFYDAEPEIHPPSPVDELWVTPQPEFVRGNLRWVKLDYHGEFNFYGYDMDGDWYEYTATFVKGKLVEITGGKREGFG